MTPESSGRLCAVLSGGDWADAGVDHLVIPHDVNFFTARRKWQLWYHLEYVPAISDYTRGARRTRPEYLSFTDWLIERCGARWARSEHLDWSSNQCGAGDATDSEITVIEGP